MGRPRTSRKVWGQFNHKHFGPIEMNGDDTAKNAVNKMEFNATIRMLRTLITTKLGLHKQLILSNDVVSLKRTG